MAPPKRKRHPKPKPPYKFIRFNPLHRDAVYMMPQVIHRIRKFIAEVTPEIDPDAFISYILKMQQDYPDGIRIWVALTQNDYPVGHFIVTADVYLNEVFLHVQQLSVDEPRIHRHVKEKVLNSMLSWVKSLNAALVAQGSPQITRLYLATGMQRNMKAWERFLKDFRLMVERKVGIFELPKETLVAPQPDALVEI